MGVDGGTLTFRNVRATAFNLEVESGTTKRAYRYDDGRAGLRHMGGGTGWSDACESLGLLDGLANELRLRAVEAFDRLGAYVPPAIARLVRGSAEVDIAVLGGRFDCVEARRNRKQIGGIGRLEWRSLKIVRNGTIFMIAPHDAAARNRQPVRMSVLLPDARDRGREIPQRTARGFQETAWRIDSAAPHGRLTDVVVGKTSYGVRIERLRDGDIRVLFRPTKEVTLFAAEDCDTDGERQMCPHPSDTEFIPWRSPTGATPPCQDDRCWSWSGQGNLIAAAERQRAMVGRTELAWRAIAAAAALVIAGALAGGPIIAFQRLVPGLRRRAAIHPYRTMRPLLLTALSVALALAPHLLGLSQLGALRVALVNWLLAGLVLLWGGSGVLLGLVWIAITVLAALGSMNLAAMVVDGDSTKWLVYFVKHRILFLDFVPPLVVAVASCPSDALRPLLHGFVAGSSGWSRLTRFVPASLLVLLFLAWYFVGRQTGFGVFQPVEAGKFAMVILAATALMSIDPRYRAGSAGVALASTVVSLVLIAGLGMVLLVVPLLRSDWSPFLIMSLLFLGVVAAFGTVVMVRSLFAQLDAQYARQQVPRVFKPGFSARWWLKRTSVYVVALAAAIGVGGWFILGSPVATAFIWVTGVKDWKDDSKSRLLALEREGLGAGRRVVAERLITWVDLDFQRPEINSCAFPSKGPTGADTRPLGLPACYVDIEYQLIRSRRIIAAAQCGFAKDMRTGPGFAEVAGVFAWMVDLVPRAATGMFDGAESVTFRAPSRRRARLPPSARSCGRSTFPSSKAILQALT